MKSLQNQDRFTFDIGKWSYHMEYGLFINQDGDEFFIENRLNRILSLLVRRNGTIVKRSEIIDSVWENVQVNEENLTKGIFDLRKLLQKKEIAGLEIETIRNIGYRLNVKKKNTRPRPILRRLASLAFYLFLILTFSILFIRAIGYENS